MNKKQKIHPVTIWMLVFVVLGLWAAYGQLAGAVFSDSSWFEPGLVTIVLVFIAGVALWTLPKFFNVDEAPNDKGRDTLGIVVGFYVEAWNQLREQKWILWLFGSVAVFQFVNGLGENMLSHFMLVDYIKKYSATSELMRFSDSGDFFILRMQLPVYVTASIKEALVYLSATVELEKNLLFAPVLVAMIGFFIYFSSKKISSIDDTKSRFPFLKNIILPFSFLCLIYGITVIIMRIKLYGSLSNPQTFLLMQTTPSYLIMLTFSTIFSVVTNSILFAGYVGSLIRMRDGGGISLETFIIDISTYFRSALRVFVIFMVTGLISAQPSTIGQLRNPSPQNPPFLAFDISAIMNLVFTVSFLLLPYVILLKNVHTKISIQSSLRRWKDNPGILITFFAVEITLSFPLLMSNRCIGQIVPGRLNQELIYGMIVGIWRAGTLTIITAIISLAIFNLYNYLTKDDIDEVADTEPILEDPDPQQWSMREV